MDDHDTGFHDHDLSAGAVAVVEGARARGAPARGRAAQPTPSSAPARSFDFAAADIHRVATPAAARR